MRLEGGGGLADDRFEGKRGVLLLCPDGKLLNPSFRIDLSVCIQIEELDSPNTSGSVMPGIGRQRSMRSGLGFPVAFFNAATTVFDPKTDRNRPRAPQFSSHSLCLSLYVPNLLAIPCFAEDAFLCEKKPSIMSV